MPTLLIKSAYRKNKRNHAYELLKPVPSSTGSVQPSSPSSARRQRTSWA